MKTMEKHYLKSVDYKEFLPNSVVNSPKHKLHTHSYTTNSLNLYGKRHSAVSSQGGRRICSTMTTFRSKTDNLSMIESELYKMAPSHAEQNKFIPFEFNLGDHELSLLDLDPKINSKNVIQGTEHKLLEEKK
jgi:hypothetical protein